MDQSKHYTAKELIGLPGMPGTEQAVNHRARREGWPSQKRAGRGGGREYPLSALPAETRDHLVNQMIAQLPEKVCPLPAVLEPAEKLPALVSAPQLPQLAQLKKYQRETMDARIYFMRLIERAVANGIGVNKAIETIVTQAQDGTLPAGAARMIPLANARKGEGRTLSYNGMIKWWSAWQKSGHNPAVLAPKDTEKLTQRALIDWIKEYDGKAKALTLAPEVPAWLPYFLDHYRLARKPSMAKAHRDMKRHLPAGIAAPSYDQVDRLCKKIPAIYLEKGRLTGAEYKALLGYAERDSSHYHPLTLGQIDGHSFKAYVAHPTTGAHFHPEVCAVICLTTKVLVGWSAGLAESWRTVADAFRHACTVNENKPWGGVFAMIEPDRGAGNMAKVNADECIGIISRVGTTWLPPERGGNPQGHGAIERSNQSIWIQAAKDLPTYTGKDMDRVARKRVYTRLERDLKKVKDAGQLGQVDRTSELLYTWPQFLDFLEEWVLRYNNRPHSALDKITAPPPDDPQGKPVRRHMTPFEAWAQAVASGWQPTRYDGDMLDHLFMPHERITVKRCQFTLHTNTYHAYELTQWHGRDMIAAYDIHDASRVWVLDLDERPVCVAKFEGNKVHARPLAQVEKAIMDREARRTQNVERKLDLIRGEADRSTIEVAPAVIELSAELLAGEEARRQKVVSLAQSRKLRDVSSPLDVYFMVLDRIKAGDATPYQLQWKKDYEYFDDTKKKLGLFLADPYCLKDPDDRRDAQTLE